MAKTLPKFYLLCQHQEPGGTYRQPTVKGASKEALWDVGSSEEAGIMPLLEAKTHSTIFLFNVFQLLQPLRSIISNLGVFFNYKVYFTFEVSTRSPIYFVPVFS